MKRYGIKEFYENILKIKPKAFRMLFPTIRHKQSPLNYIEAGYIIEQGRQTKAGTKTSIVKVTLHDPKDLVVRKVDGKIELTKILHTTVIKD